MNLDKNLTWWNYWRDW